MSDESDSNDNVTAGHESSNKPVAADNDTETDEKQQQQEDDQEDTKPTIKKKKKKIHKLSLTKTEDFNKKLRKRGVVYVARVPPKMTPTKIKTLLGEFDGAEVTRVYLVEEDSATRKRRRKMAGGNAGSSKRYTEGWVEFDNKRVAKHVAMSLNNTAITNIKRNPHYGDLWALKYLHKFQWCHLTEKVAYERRVREQKLRLETMQAKRETAAYKELVETGKKLDKIAARKKRRAEREGKPIVEGAEEEEPKQSKKHRNSHHSHRQQQQKQHHSHSSDKGDGHRRTNKDNNNNKPTKNALLSALV